MKKLKISAHSVIRKINLIMSVTILIMKFIYAHFIKPNLAESNLKMVGTNPIFKLN